MKKLTLLLIFFFVLFSCKTEKKNYLFVNPSNSIEVNFNINTQNIPIYNILHKNDTVLDNSQLGIIREDMNFYNNMELISVLGPIEVDETYNMFQGKKKHINYMANQYIVELKNESNKKMNIIFNLSKDGVAFKYIFPEKSESVYKIEDEKTTYNFVANTKGWLQPMSRAKTGWEQVNPSYEEYYLSEIPVNEKSPIGEGWVYPTLFNTNDTWILISETGLDSNYCGTRLTYNNEYKALQVSFPQKEEAFP